MIIQYDIKLLINEKDDNENRILNIIKQALNDYQISNEVILNQKTLK
ncbi:hypothetical protein [Clostridium beijerinckii]|nr:hypothetical protein [Clostridium beijerinckii]NRU52393.1 hypothetical protein [Clostridium beijerinckii]NRU52693.1 hypothetical protein [Clostridium beijerinckii]NYC68735.1 hypothetical protein [Clostridium beijerinckii]NYC91884.1 hypothetical protein [Clostridium beijerinckii]